ncbi:MAG: hypothetical protein ACUVWN_14320 [bacterium]
MGSFEPYFSDKRVTGWKGSLWCFHQGNRDYYRSVHYYWLDTGMGWSTNTVQALGKRGGMERICDCFDSPDIYRRTLFTVFPLLKTLRDKGASIACVIHL